MLPTVYYQRLERMVVCRVNNNRIHDEYINFFVLRFYYLRSIKILNYSRRTILIDKSTSFDFELASSYFLCRIIDNNKFDYAA